MNALAIPQFDEQGLQRAISDAQHTLKQIRQDHGRWRDGATADWSDAEWSKGSVMLAEGLLCFLYPNMRLKEHFGSLKLPESILDEDMAGLLAFANSVCYHALPYVATDTSFTETAATMLSAFSHFMAKRSAVPVGLKEKYLNDVGSAARHLIQFLSNAAACPSKGTRAWAATEVTRWSAPGIGKAKPMQLDTTYSTDVALKALYDAHSLYPGLPDDERNELEAVIREGISGLIELYDVQQGSFALNKASSEKNVIHSVFALEGILYCQGMLDEHDQFKSSIAAATNSIVKRIGTRLQDLSTFDQDIAWHYGFGRPPDAQLGLMDDRSTIGSIANVLCMSLRYLPPGEDLEAVYETIDALISEFFRRRNTDTNIWPAPDFRVYYTMRMIESLTICLELRPEPTFTLSRRSLSQLLRRVLSADEVIWGITERLLKQAGSLDLQDS